MISVSEFKPENYLHTEEAVTDYLNAALEEANTFENLREGAAYFADALGVAARARRKMPTITSSTQRPRSHS
ncbi:hypothetical protein KIM372_01110 [Bombiscardovia nodaiensis]|uniref:Addiction module antidote protein n=1 Tax=Bombiscardovia nodaiensis TaxID=2932181 RepID=A0ABN6S7L4_9BIFI|nr:hypothetical protein KIM372_01110 [Bombiscardovia nodaiensis]